MDGLLRLLDLEEVGLARLAVSGTSEDASDPAERGMRVFSGPSHPTPHLRVFGGQVLAQCVVAAGRTVQVESSRPIHSLHAYFVRPGDSLLPIRFAVEELRDGNSFSVRRVHALQHGKAILSMTCSFQEPADGVDHQDVMPAVPAPEDLPSMAESFGGAQDLASVLRREQPIELRHVEGHVHGGARRPVSADQHVWMRTVAPLPDDDLIHAATLAFSSDYTILEAALRRHELSWDDPRLRVASLDHALWFHRRTRMDDWLLYAAHSPSVQGGRGLAFGQLFARDGALLASVAQEGMLRIKGL